MELGMNFLAADDMSAVLQATLRKSIGLGITANMHITGMHVEGKVYQSVNCLYWMILTAVLWIELIWFILKVLVGVKFIRRWPFLGRVRICFVEPPYFQMIAKPLVSHGLDVTELPGISQWLVRLYLYIYFFFRKLGWLWRQLYPFVVYLHQDLV